jgi:hypothetical protein
MSWAPLVILILVALACFFFALDLKKTVLTRLSDQGTTIVGQKVLIQDISFHFPAIVDLYGIVVKNPEGFPSGDLLRIKRLHLNIHLSQLLRGHFSLRRLVAFSPEVELIKNEKGEWNMSGTLRQRLLQESPVQTKYPMDELRVESGRFTFNRDPAFTVEGIEVKFKNLLSDPGAKTDVEGNGVYLGNKFQAEGSLFLQETPPRVDIHLSSGDFVLSAFKKYLEPYNIGFEKTRWALNVSLQGSQERGFQIRSSMQQVKGPGIFQRLSAVRNIQFQADATYQPTSDILTLHSGTLRAEGMSVTAIGSVTEVRTNPSYQIEGRIDSFDLSKLFVMKDLKVAGKLISRNVKIQGKLKNGAPRISGSIHLRDGEMRSPQATVEKMQADLDCSWTEDLSIKGDLSARILKVGELLPDSWAGRSVHLRTDATFSLHHDSLIIHTGTFDGDGISGTFQGTLTDLKKNAFYQCEVQLDRLSLAAFQLSRDFELSGTVTSRNIQIRGTLKGGTPESSGLLHLEDGRGRLSQVTLEKIRGDFDFKLEKDLSIKADASAHLTRAGNIIKEKPVEVRWLGMFQGNPEQMVTTSSFHFSPLDVRLADEKTLHLGKSDLKISGTIQEDSFSGNHLFETEELRYGEWTLRGLRTSSTLDFQNDDLTLRDVRLEGEGTRGHAAQVKVSGVQQKKSYGIDLQGMEIHYRNDDFVLEQSDVAWKMDPAKGHHDFRFSAGTLGHSGISLHRIAGNGRLEGKDLSLDLPQAEFSGGTLKLSARGKVSETIFPVRLSMTLERGDLGALSKSAAHWITLPYQVEGKANKLLFEGTVLARDALDGQILVEADKISVFERETKRTLVRDGALRAKIDCLGKDLTLRADATVGPLSAQLSGTGTRWMEKDRGLTLKLSVPGVNVPLVREVFWDVFPDSLLYVGLEGSISSALSLVVHGQRWNVEGEVLLKECRLSGENGEYSIGPINGSFPLRYGKTSTQGSLLTLPTHEKSEFDQLLHSYERDPLEQGSQTVKPPAHGAGLPGDVKTITGSAFLPAFEAGHPADLPVTLGALNYGFPLLEDIRLRSMSRDSSLNVFRFDAKIFNGQLYGSGALDLSEGLNFRGGFLVKGVSLKALCDTIPPIRGFISGKVDGIVSVKGSGTGLSNLVGKGEFWVDPKAGEKMMISREFLQKVGGISAKLYLGDRRFNRGILEAYLKDGYVIFKELELSNRNLLGMTDLSVKVAPFNNRIDLDHLLWTITEAATRAKEKK